MHQLDQLTGKALFIYSVNQLPALARRRSASVFKDESKQSYWFKWDLTSFVHFSSATHVASAGFEGLAPQGPPTNVEYPHDAIRQRVLASTRKQGGFGTGSKNYSTITRLLWKEFGVFLIWFIWKHFQSLVFICWENPRRLGILFLPTVPDISDKAWFSDVSKIPDDQAFYSLPTVQDKSDTRHNCLWQSPDEFGRKWKVRQKLKLAS